MPRLKCPRCATVIDVAPGASPVCPACGFGGTGAGGPAAPAPAPAATPFSPEAWPPSPPPGPYAPPGGFASPPPMGMAPGMQRTSGKAIAALVLGIVSVCIAIYLGIICGVIGLILGILGMKEVDRNPQTMKGKGMAIAGVVLGAIGIVLQLVFLLVFGLAFATIFQCLENPEAEGCEDFQDPDADAQVAWSTPAKPGPAWTAPLGLVGASDARAWIP